LVAILAVAVYVTAFFPKQDFAVYYAAGQSLLSGRSDLYAPDFANAGVMDYRYPPVFVLLFLPFAAFPFTAAAYLWAVIGLSAMAHAFKEVACATGIFFKTNRLKIAVIAATLLTAKYLLISLKYQNVHMLIIAAIFISFCLPIKNKIVPAALLMALAIAIKIFPVVLLPYFAIKRQWHFLAFTCAFVMFFLFVPAFYFGIDRNIELHKQWYSHVVESSEFYELNGPPNLSIQGQTSRYLTSIDYEAREEDKAYVNVNFADLEPTTAQLMGKVLAAVVGLVTFLILFLIDRKQNSKVESNRSGFDTDTMVEFAFLVSMMLLIGPRTNIIYFTALFLPLLVLVVRYIEKRSVPMIIALFVVLITTVVLPLVPGAQAQRLFLVLGVDTIATFVVWLALGWDVLTSSRMEIMAGPNVAT
jgi:hypothetical protein